jgi:hypothetical protein
MLLGYWTSQTDVFDGDIFLHSILVPRFLFWDQTPKQPKPPHLFSPWLGQAGRRLTPPMLKTSWFGLVIFIDMVGITKTKRKKTKSENSRE